jgi:hypothetical protein
MVGYGPAKRTSVAITSVLVSVKVRRPDAPRRVDLDRTVSPPQLRTARMSDGGAPRLRLRRLGPQQLAWWLYRPNGRVRSGVCPSHSAHLGRERCTIVANRNRHPVLDGDAAGARRVQLTSNGPNGAGRRFRFASRPLGGVPAAG